MTEMVLQEQNLLVIDKVRETQQPWWRAYGLQAIGALMSCALTERLPR